MIGNKTEKALIEYSKREALGDYQLLEKCVNLVRKMQENITKEYQKGSRRRELVAYLEEQLYADQRLLGTWVGFEPDLFDGEDYHFSDEPHSDHYGRFVPYCYRDENDAIKVTPLENIDQEHFYNIPKEKQELVILDPFTYNIEGVDVLMTSVAAPIYKKNKVVGVTGLDIKLKIAKEIFPELVHFRSGLENTDLKKIETIVEGERTRHRRVLAYTVKALVNNQNEILSELKDSSSHMLENASNLKSTSSETSNSSEELAKTTEDLTQKITSQTEYTQQTAEDIEQLGKLVENNQGILQELNQVMNMTVKATQDSENTLGDLQEKINSINNIVYEIQLISLNASIEAVKAGEAGRGFSVVAAEVRKLANQSSEALTNIVSVAEDLYSKFNQINHTIEKTNQVVEKISSSGNSIKQTEEEALEKIQQLSKIAEDNAANVEEVSAVAEQQSNAAEEVERISSELHQMSNSLLEAVKKLGVE